MKRIEETRDPEKNRAILKAKEELFNRITDGPRVGDFVRLPSGRLDRFTSDWGESIQAGGTRGSFFIYGSCCSYSGSLYSSIEKHMISPTDEKKMGEVWFFDENETGPGRGVYAEISFNVYEIKEEYREKVALLWGYGD